MKGSRGDQAHVAMLPPSCGYRHNGVLHMVICYFLAQTTAHLGRCLIGWWRPRHFYLLSVVPKFRNSKVVGVDHLEATDQASRCHWVGVCCLVLTICLKKCRAQRTNTLSLHHNENQNVALWRKVSTVHHIAVQFGDVTYSIQTHQ